LGLQVSRITRVSNYGQSQIDNANSINVTQSMLNGRPGNGAEVVTQVRVWIDFVLKPR
jgi:hypothetical protein